MPSERKRFLPGVVVDGHGQIGVTAAVAGWGANTVGVNVTSRRFTTRKWENSVSVTFIVASLILLALIIRLPFIFYISEDYIHYFGYWYNYIVDNGYYSALKYNFSNYTIYNYLLATAAVLFPYYKLLSIKVIAIVFDFILAFFVYKCVRLKYESKIIPILAASATLLAPTVIINSALWGQIDAMYTAFMVATLYALLVKRQGWAFVAFGLSLSIKSQAVFLAPLFLWLLLKKEINIRYFLLSPLVYLITLLPGWLIGRPLDELLFINVRYYGSWSVLQRGFPNLYQWIPNSYYNWYLWGVVLTIIVISIYSIILLRTQLQITRDSLIYLATLSVIITPYFLPRMSDRYFFPADIITIILAFYMPKYWIVPILINFVSFKAYQETLFHGYDISPISLSFFSLDRLAVIPLALIVFFGWQLKRKAPSLQRNNPTYKFTNSDS